MKKPQRTVEEQGQRNRAAFALNMMRDCKRKRLRDSFHYAKGSYSAMCIELARNRIEVSY